MDSVFSYRKGTSFLHTTLHPFTKMVMFLVVVILSGLWLDIRYLLPLLATGLVLAYIARVPAKLFLFIVLALGLTWFPTVRSTVAQARPEYFKVLDPEWASTGILTINVPFLGLDRLGLTYGSLYWLAGRVCRFAAVVTWGIVFLYTTPISDIANTLYALRVPPSVVFVVQITYKFIPYMASIINQIQDAQKLRGWNLRTLNLVKVFKRSLPLANPLMRRTAMIVEQVTIASQIRGFGSGKVTPLRDLTLSWLDKLIIVLFIGGLIFAFIAMAIWRAGMI
ncbi:MAG: energy-coupling factor transporter transmembrane protein EcfT [Anaerolineales bacterium]|nr:energy-coupling factor transporter transmembrane protein EcfT [Anaerolineales bacterium]MDW8161240.1 energy-coupling factor transporter transmembrane component T [Anaerolineales bacterium]